MMGCCSWQDGRASSSQCCSGALVGKTAEPPAANAVVVLWLARRPSLQQPMLWWCFGWQDGRASSSQCSRASKAAVVLWLARQSCNVSGGPNQSIQTKGSRRKLNANKTIAHDDATPGGRARNILEKIIDLATRIELTDNFNATT